MKKIIAILLALAVVSMAFAQTVSISNELSTSPCITINRGQTYWGFDSAFLEDKVTGEAITADGRAKVKGVVKFDLDTLSPNEESILSFKPRWSWNSLADNGAGNRSAVAAVLKPWDFLEIGIGNLGCVGYDFGAGPNLDWSEWSTWYAYGFNTIPGVAGKWQRLSSLVYDGIHVAYVGVPGLKIGAGLTSARSQNNSIGDSTGSAQNRNTMIKKGMFNGFSLGATYGNDIFGVGAIYKGNFGTETGTLAKESDKAYQDHTLYANITFNGLQEAKIGTKLYADVAFHSAKASNLIAWSYYDSVAKKSVSKNNTSVTSFFFNVGAGFNFRNGISDDVTVGVGYYKIGSTTSKVLPFHIRNTINYSVSSDARFQFVLGYSQSGLAEKKTVAGANNANKNLITAAESTSMTPTTDNGYGWLVYAYPNFSFSMGAHSFNMGVKSIVWGDIVPHAKQGHEWAWTGLRGQEAKVIFPISWTYTF